MAKRIEWAQFEMHHIRPTERNVEEAKAHALIAIAEQLQLANLIAMTVAEQEERAEFTPDMHALADITREDQDR